VGRNPSEQPRKVGLEARLQHELGRRLAEPVLDRRDAERPLLGAPGLGDQHPPQGPGRVALLPELRFKLVEERLEPALLDRGDRDASSPAAPRCSRTCSHARCSTSRRWMRSQNAWKRLPGDRLAARYSLTWSSRTLSISAVLSPEGMRRSSPPQQAGMKQGPFPRPGLWCPAGYERYYGPPATLPAGGDFAEGLDAPLASHATGRAWGQRGLPHFPQRALRPCRSLYPGGFWTAALPGSPRRPWPSP
jgi:hypothetical protein